LPRKFVAALLHQRRFRCPGRVRFRAAWTRLATGRQLALALRGRSRSAAFAQRALVKLGFSHCHRVPRWVCCLLASGASPPACHEFVHLGRIAGVSVGQLSPAAAKPKRSWPWRWSGVSKRIAARSCCSIGAEFSRAGASFGERHRRYQQQPCASQIAVRRWARCFFFVGRGVCPHVALLLSEASRSARIACRRRRRRPWSRLGRSAAACMGSTQ